MITSGNIGLEIRNSLSFSIAHTAKNTIILPDFLVSKFCGKARFPHSFGWIAVSVIDMKNLLYLTLVITRHQRKPAFLNILQQKKILIWKVMWLIENYVWKLWNNSKYKTVSLSQFWIKVIEPQKNHTNIGQFHQCKKIKILLRLFGHDSFLECMESSCWSFKPGFHYDLMWDNLIKFL